MNPVQQSFTYSNITVSYSDAQKNLVLSDQNNINSLLDQIKQLTSFIASKQNEINGFSAAVSDNPHGSCYTPVYVFGQLVSWKVDSQCINDNNAAWNNARADSDVAQGKIDNINNSLMPAAVKKLNDDIATIQNDIKLQIQAQLANSASNTNSAAASNLPNQSNLNNQQALAALNNQAAQDKLKQEENIKIFQFIVVAIVILGVVFFVAKRV